MYLVTYYSWRGHMKKFLDETNVGTDKLDRRKFPKYRWHDSTF